MRSISFATRSATPRIPLFFKFFYMASYFSFRLLAISVIWIGSITPAAFSATLIPPSFVTDAPATRHDTIAQVTMDDGARLWVKVLGDDKRKPLVIALHGAPGKSSHLEPEASFGFMSDRYRVLVFDARGSGASDLKRPYTHARWIKDIDLLRRWAGVEKFVLIGGSYGTFVSLEYALSYPSRVQALILRGASAYGPSVAQDGLKASLSTTPVDRDRQRRMWSGRLRDDKDFELGFAEFASAFAPPADKALPLDERAPVSTKKAKPVFHAATQNWAFSRNIPAYDVRTKLGSIKAPTLLMVGKYDRITVPAGAELIARSIPSSTLVIFDHSGHSVPSDEPAKLQSAVNDFLSTIGTSSSPSLESK